MEILSIEEDNPTPITKITFCKRKMVERGVSKVKKHFSCDIGEIEKIVSMLREKKRIGINVKKPKKFKKAQERIIIEKKKEAVKVVRKKVVKETKKKIKFVPPPPREKKSRKTIHDKPNRKPLDSKLVHLEFDENKNQVDISKTKKKCQPTSGKSSTEKRNEETKKKKTKGKKVKREKIGAYKDPYEAELEKLRERIQEEVKKNDSINRIVRKLKSNVYLKHTAEKIKHQRFQNLQRKIYALKNKVTQYRSKEAKRQRLQKEIDEEILKLKQDRLNLQRENRRLRKCIHNDQFVAYYPKKLEENTRRERPFTNIHVLNRRNEKKNKKKMRSQSCKIYGRGTRIRRNHNFLFGFRAPNATDLSKLGEKKLFIKSPSLKVEADQSDSVNDFLIPRFRVRKSSSFSSTSTKKRGSSSFSPHHQNKRWKLINTSGSRYGLYDSFSSLRDDYYLEQEIKRRRKNRGRKKYQRKMKTSQGFRRSRVLTGLSKSRNQKLGRRRAKTTSEKYRVNYNNNNNNYLSPNNFCEDRNDNHSSSSSNNQQLHLSSLQDMVVTSQSFTPASIPSCQEYEILPSSTTPTSRFSQNEGVEYVTRIRSCQTSETELYHKGEKLMSILNTHNNNNNNNDSLHPVSHQHYRTGDNYYHSTSTTPPRHQRYRSYGDSRKKKKKKKNIRRTKSCQGPRLKGKKKNMEKKRKKSSDCNSVLGGWDMN